MAARTGCYNCPKASRKAASWPSALGLAIGLPPLFSASAMTFPDQPPSAPPTSETKVLDWRSQSGYLSAFGSEAASSQILLGRFLGDRTSPNPLIECSLL